MNDEDKNYCVEYFQDSIIEIFEDKTYTHDSNDNINNYLFEYFSKQDEYYSSKFGIIINNNDKIINSAIIWGHGGYTSLSYGNYIIEDNLIMICCGNTLFSLSLPELKLNWKIEIDEVSAFEITKMNDDYIIRGELAISRISKEGKIIWQKYGSDIFITWDEDFYFDIIDNNIFTISWDGNKYKFNYDDGEDEYNK